MSVDVIRIMCPKLTCRRILAVPAETRGRTVRCKGCATVIRVPEKAQPVETPPGDANKPGATGKSEQKGTGDAAAAA